MLENNYDKIYKIKNNIKVYGKNYTQMFFQAASKPELAANPISRHAVFSLALPLFNWATKEFSQTFQEMIMAVGKNINSAKQ